MIYGENLKITFANVPSWEDTNEWSLLADPNAPLVKLLAEQVIFRQYANRLNWHRPRRKISWRHLTRAQKAAALDFYLGE